MHKLLLNKIGYKSYTHKHMKIHKLLLNKEDTVRAIHTHT